MKVSYSCFFFFIFLVALSCGSDTELHQVFDENEKLIEEYTRNTKNLAKEGLYTRYHDDGETPAEQVHFNNDTMQGYRVYFNEKGDTITLSKIKNGVLEGIHKEFHANGKVSQEYQHVNGIITGTFKEFYESGALKGEIQFSDNNENGHFVEFHENGKKAWEGTNKDGKENGEVLKFDENGELIRKMNCLKGRCETIWKKEGIED